MSVLRVNKIADRTGSGSVEFSNGFNLPSGYDLNVNSLNVTGITTTTSVNVTNVTLTGVCTASSFVGNGAGLTNVPGIQNSKAIGIAFIVH